MIVHVLLCQTELTQSVTLFDVDAPSHQILRRTSAIPEKNHAKNWSSWTLTRHHPFTRSYRGLNFAIFEKLCWTPTLTCFNFLRAHQIVIGTGRSVLYIISAHRCTAVTCSTLLSQTSVSLSRYHPSWGKRLLADSSVESFLRLRSGVSVCRRRPVKVYMDALWNSLRQPHHHVCVQLSALPYLQ